LAGPVAEFALSIQVTARLAEALPRSHDHSKTNKVDLAFPLARAT
jgi:hypothetical protein